MTFGRFHFRVEKEGTYRLEVPISSGFSAVDSDFSSSTSSIESGEEETSSPRFISTRASEKLAKIFSDMSFESSADSYISDGSSSVDSFNFIDKSTTVGKVFANLHDGVTKPSIDLNTKYHQIYVIGEPSRDQEETSEAFDDLGNPYVDPSDLRRGLGNKYIGSQPRDRVQLPQAAWDRAARAMDGSEPMATTATPEELQAYQYRLARAARELEKQTIALNRRREAASASINDSMIAYKEVYNELEKLFDGCEVNHISRLSNDEADVLANIGSQCLAIPPGVFWEEIAERSTKPKKAQKKTREEKTSGPLKEVPNEEEDQELVMMVEVPWMQAIVTDNGSNFTSKEFKEYCAEVGIKLHFASVGHPQTNGQVEKANGIICNGIKKRLLGPLEKARHTWPEELPSVLWSIRTTPNTATQETPFFLVHGAEAVLPIEIEHDSPRVTEYDEETSRKALEDDVDALDEAQDEVLSRVTKYQQDLKNYHSRRLRPRSFQVGDLVLRLNQKSTEKLESPWLGPYIVTEVIEGGAYRIKDKKIGVPEKNPWSVAQLRRFYA
ncbi:hypothetical protein QYE76_065870 [Lolium multiflorum]|uniref:Integrase catalytic domain-containing protein n=1 Tax=Lolium multiflorum TaxID=4521 RepID=A0AAD8WAB7_LOLMU|nr:hypothetical protein QYE76_065870 [Lolium multiflorum]